MALERSNDCSLSIYLNGRLSLNWHTAIQSIVLPKYICFVLRFFFIYISSLSSASIKNESTPPDILDRCLNDGSQESINDLPVTDQWSAEYETWKTTDAEYDGAEFVFTLTSGHPRSNEIWSGQKLLGVSSRRLAITAEGISQ